LFQTEHENWNNNWMITWNHRIDLQNWNVYENQIGYANGLHRDTDDEYLNDDYKGFCLPILKFIYKGLVTEWPAWTLA
jgi:hypothetical protein